jgi:hypothetical protein
MPAAMQVLYLITGQSRKGLAFCKGRNRLFDKLLYQNRTARTLTIDSIRSKWLAGIAG